MKSYNLFDVKGFPEERSFSTNLQYEQTDTELTTEFQFSGHLEAGFDIYDVAHMSRVKLRGQPYSGKRILHEVSERISFEGYLHEDRSLLVLSYSKQVCREAARRLSHLETNTAATPVKINITDFAKECSTIYSSHFREIQAPNLTATAVFGPGVERSDLYRTLQQLGIQSALSTEFPHDGETHRIMVTKEGGVIFFRETTTNTALEIIVKLRPILDKCREKPTPGDIDNDDDGGFQDVTDLLSLL